MVYGCYKFLYRDNIMAFAVVGLFNYILLLRAGNDCFVGSAVTIAFDGVITVGVGSRQLRVANRILWPVHQTPSGASRYDLIVMQKILNILTPLVPTLRSMTSAQTIESVGTDVLDSLI